MNRLTFIDAISTIGWTVQPSWNGLNDKLVSPNGVVTDIRVCDDCLEPYSNHLYGGESFNIYARWYFKDAYINTEEKFVAINNLLLMNHDKK